MKNILKLYEKKKMKPKYINFSDLREKKKDIPGRDTIFIR